MSRMVCPECGEDVERGDPRGARGGAGVGWAIDVEVRRLQHRHRGDREPLCPVVTSRGYQPALPKRSR